MAYYAYFVSLVFLYIGGLDTSVSANNCGQQKFNSKFGGNIKFSGNFSPPITCTYEIKVESGTRIVLEWGRFIVNGDMPSCHKSSVAVYIGCSSRKVSDFCSRNTDSLPHAIYSTDNCMKLVFHSTSTAYEAFSATYKVFGATDPQSTSSCSSKRDLTSKSNVIISPHWPSMQTKAFFGDECEWEIKVPSNYVVKMNFMDLDLKKSSFYCKSSSNRLRLKGEKSVLTSSENKEYYCDDRTPFSKTTRYYQLELEYKFGSLSSYRHRGFAVGYIAYKTEETEKAAKSQARLAYIGLGVAIVVLVSCCIFFAWRRRKRSQQSGRATYQPPPSQETHTAIASQPKAPDYGIGPQSGAPPPYSASMAQPPYQGYPAQTYPPSSYPPAAPYPTNAAPYQTSGAPYPPTSVPSEPYPGAMAYPGPTAAPPYQGDAPYQASAPYPPSQPPYPTDTTAQAPYPTK